MKKSKLMFLFLFIISLPLIFTACGGGGGGGGGPVPSSTCVDVAGTWTTTEQVNATACGQGTFIEHLTYTITQSGCTITVVKRGQVCS